MKRTILDWLESRTGLESAVRNFMLEEIPASAGWPQVFGSVALFCFLLQAFTGMLLSFNYAPTPGEAHNSLRFLMSEVTGGKLIRGLHHWGASMMIVVVALHMIQVFLWGAYKKPREATWLVGLVLLNVTLAFGLTGYLLPWDNRAYWGTVVTTQIAAKAPLAGEYLSRLMGVSEGGVGVVTFARFYSLHVMLLPLLTAALVAIHIVLVRRHGVTPSPGDDKPKKPFFPGQVFKDTVAIFIAFAILFVLAILAEAPLGRLADPTDTTYIPRPEWYFLFLFQTLKFFEGPLEIIGSMVLPGLAMTALALLPFVDRAKVTRFAQRSFAFVAVGLAGIGWAALTAAAIVSTPKQAADQESAEPPAEWQFARPEVIAGLGHFRRENCVNCHVFNGKGKPVGPDLTRLGGKRNVRWLIDHFRQPQELVPGSTMPPLQLPDAQLSALALFVLELKPSNAAIFDSVPDMVAEGAMIYQRFQCGVCHQVNGAGMKLGPPLNGVTQRREPSWIAGHFREPQKFSPGSTMPPYRFSDRDTQRMQAYLESLPLRYEAPAARD